MAVCVTTAPVAVSDRRKGLARECGMVSEAVEGDMKDQSLQGVRRASLIDLRRNAPNKVGEADGTVGERDAADRS